MLDSLLGQAGDTNQENLDLYLKINLVVTLELTLQKRVTIFSEKCFIQPGFTKEEMSDKLIEMHVCFRWQSDVLPWKIVVL